jgi:hypothetical protein
MVSIDMVDKLFHYLIRLMNDSINRFQSDSKVRPSLSALLFVGSNKKGPC